LEIVTAAALACHAGLSAETSVKEEALAKAGHTVYPACLAEVYEGRSLPKGPPTC
jgi:hypothetical protein